jgi:carboxyl-terminal processing protease
VLDLRGNPGGLFKVAIQVAERFLAEGIIVSTQGQARPYNRTYEAHSGAGALDLPLIVMVDGDTASAAEVVAGALKENQRATLVGQTTFGKGSVQCVLQLSSAAAGIRVTVARFFSPRGHGYSSTGITPHIVVDPGDDMIPDRPSDRQLEMALQEAARLYAMRP